MKDVDLLAAMAEEIPPTITKFGDGDWFLRFGPLGSRGPRNGVVTAQVERLIRKGHIHEQWGLPHPQAFLTGR